MTIDSDSLRFKQVLKSAILLPVGTILAAFLLLLILAFWLFDSVKWSDHSYQVLAQTRTCERLVIEMQNQIRGYLLTKDHSFVDSFNQDHARVDGAFNHLQDLVQDNPTQTSKAYEVIQAKNTWLAHAVTSITQPAQVASMQPEWTKSGKSMMDDVLSRFAVFTAEEERLRDIRLHNVNRMWYVLCYVGIALVLILSTTIAQVVRRYFMTLAADYGSALSAVEQRNAALVLSEASLEEQKEWFRVTLASIGDGVIVTDREGQVVFMNEESERLTGWVSVEALLKPLVTVFNIVNEETRATVENPVTKVFREKKVVGLANHTLLISKKGDEWPIEDSAAPIYDAKGALLGVVLVFHNAIEMRQAQNTLKAYSEDLEKKIEERTLTLQQTIAELETFSYTVSHDLRSPLRAMQGFADAVLEDYGSKIDEQGKNYLSRIKNAAERLDRLIQDLLSYTRFSRQDAPLSSIDLNRMIRDIIEHNPNLQPLAEQIQIEGPLPNVMGHDIALTQVLSNLLGNAVKFVPPGTVPHIRVSSETMGSRVRLWIQDNGIGISPADYERIFKIFVQVNDSQTYGGTGVGLAIVKKAVQAMQGTLGVESEAGKGSRFWVELGKG